jgi:hypothetical protein
MTGPEDHSNTRPISVAELLAKNGTIGAPPVGGRRRRRRGDSDAVTVAELTGEIPIVGSDHDHHVADSETTRTIPAVVDEHAASTNGTRAHVEERPENDDYAGDYEDNDLDAALDDDLDDDYADAVADYAAHVEQRDTDDDPIDFFAPPPRRPQYTPDTRRFGAAGHAEEMSPDPVDVDDDLFNADLAAEPEVDHPDTDVEDHDDRRDELPSYLRSSAGTLFGGETVADDLARGGARPRPEDIDLDEHEDSEPAPTAMSSFLRAAWVVGQCIIAVAFGAGLFIAFDQLWKWNNIVALVLSVLVILGLVAGVRVVRKTEDIGSTLIAVAVGALVTLGPLALLQSG